MATFLRPGLSRDYARLLLVMRRMIREEFSVTVHLDEPDANDRLLGFAGRSENHMLKEMAAELASMLREQASRPDTSSNAPGPGEEVAYYRGVPVRREKPRAADPAEHGSSATTRIYRGRKLES